MISNPAGRLAGLPIYLVFLSLCYFEINNIVCTFKMKV